MTALVNFLSAATKDQFIFQPGRVLYLFCEFTEPPKQKYLALVAPPEAARAPLFFVINSQVCSFIQNRPHLMECQIKLSPGDCAFLSHDSYLNCSEVITSISEQTIMAQIAQNALRVKDCLNTTTLQQILSVVATAKTISAYHQRLIFAFLSQE